MGLNIALPCLKGPQSERNKQLIVQSELWLSTFLIVSGELMALKRRLSAGESTVPSAETPKQILKAKEIIDLKIMPC